MHKGHREPDGVVKVGPGELASFLFWKCAACSCLFLLKPPLFLFFFRQYIRSQT